MEFDGGEVRMDLSTAARVASALRSLEHYRRRDGAVMPADLARLRDELAGAVAAARLSVPQPGRNSSAPVRLDERLTVAQAAARVGVTDRAIRKMAAADPRLAGCRVGRVWWIPASVADDWAERRRRTVSRAAIAQADAELERLAAEHAALNAQVSDVEERLDAARREWEATVDAADLAATRGDVVSEAWGRETAEAVACTVADLEAELRSATQRRSALFARLHPMEQARRTVDALTVRAEVDAGLALVIEAADKAVAAAQRWEIRRRATDGRVEPSRFVADLLRVPTSMPYLNAVRRAQAVDGYRRQRADAEQARITTVEGS